MADAVGTILKIDSGGRVSTAASGLDSPYGLAFDSDGNLYAANNFDNSISQTDTINNETIFRYVNNDSRLNSPFGLAYKPGFFLYTSNSGSNTISTVIPGSTFGSVFSTFASGLSIPTGLAFDSSGNLYAANSGNNTISKITPSGTTFASGTVSNFASGLNIPYGLAFDGSGNLYAANLGDSTISKITSGGVVSPFISSGLNSPTFLAVRNDTLYISDLGTSRILTEPLTPVPFEFSPALGVGILGGFWLVRKGLKKKSTKL